MSTFENPESAVGTKRPASEQEENASTNDDNDAKRLKTSGEVDGEQGDDNDQRPRERWIAHQLAEDYVGLVKRIMYTSPQYHLPQSQQQPHQVMSRSRAVSILECWNPREIALFEAGIWMHGKEFHKIALMVKTKSTKDVVAFYYIWKKTCHYQEWKAKYTSDDESESGDEEAHDE